MTVQTVDTNDDRGASLVTWAEGARAAHTIAQSLSRTAFVPAAMKGKPEEVTAAILCGIETGLQPLAALRSINIIQGTPALTALAMRGLVQSHGHEVWVEESTSARAVVAGQRKGSEHVQRITWTLDRAQRLGLTSKDQWKKQPEAMLVARATSEVCRLVAADVLLGVPYAVEELQEADEPPKVKRTAQRKAAAEIEAPPLEEHAEPDRPADEPPPEPEVEPWPEVALPGGDS